MWLQLRGWAGLAAGCLDGPLHGVSGPLPVISLHKLVSGLPQSMAISGRQTAQMAEPGSEAAQGTCARAPGNKEEAVLPFLTQLWKEHCVT